MAENPSAADAAPEDPATGRRVVLHIGTPKSGTTYLQELMWQSRERLLEAGVLYPGTARQQHFWAAVDLQGRDFNDWPDPGVEGAWERLVAEAAAHPGTTVISHELIGELPAQTVARIMADLAPAEISVVITARDLARQFPAVWQEDVKNRHWMTLQEFLDTCRPGSGSDAWWVAKFWQRQDLPALVRKWSAFVPVSRITLVTIPQRGGDPGLLWRRFASVIGVDPAVGNSEGTRRNKSLGVAEAELLRRLNARLQMSLDWPVYAPRITYFVADSVLPERAGARPLRLPAAAADWVRDRSVEIVEELAALGCSVVGDLDDLRVPASLDVDDGPPPTDGELLDAALDAIAALIPLPAPPPVPEPEPVVAVSPRPLRALAAVLRKVPLVRRLPRLRHHAPLTAPLTVPEGRPEPGSGAAAG